MVRAVLLALVATASACTQPASNTSTAQASHSSATSATPTPPSTPRTAQLFKSCAPWDGGAMELVVDDHNDCSNADRARLTISIWKGLPLAAGKTYRFDRSSQEGSARRCPGGGGRCDVATAAQLVFDAIDEKTATGHYTTTFADGSSLTESFTATSCPGEPRCG